MTAFGGPRPRACPQKPTTLQVSRPDPPGGRLRCPAAKVVGSLPAYLSIERYEFLLILKAGASPYEDPHVIGDL